VSLSGGHVCGWFGINCAADRHSRSGWTAGGGCPCMGSLGTRVWVAVVGDRGDHSTDVFEGGASDIADSGVEGAEHEFGARKIDGAADQRVDDLHDGGLNGFAVFKKSDMVEARVRAFDGAEHALVEVAELLSAKSWGATTVR
jgi:hypothetical protein